MSPSGISCPAFMADSAHAIRDSISTLDERLREARLSAAVFIALTSSGATFKIDSNFRAMNTKGGKFLQKEFDFF